MKAQSATDSPRQQNYASGVIGLGVGIALLGVVGIILSQRQLGAFKNISWHAGLGVTLGGTVLAGSGGCWKRWLTVSQEEDDRPVLVAVEVRRQQPESDAAPMEPEKPLRPGAVAPTAEELRRFDHEYGRFQKVRALRHLNPGSDASTRFLIAFRAFGAVDRRYGESVIQAAVSGRRLLRLAIAAMIRDMDWTLEGYEDGEYPDGERGDIIAANFQIASNYAAKHQGPLIAKVLHLYAHLATMFMEDVTAGRLKADQTVLAQIQRLLRQHPVQ